MNEMHSLATSTLLPNGVVLITGGDVACSGSSPELYTP
jgi:hypothetical protein